MRVALFSDVHGNLAALEAVLADIAGQGVDTAVFAGDLCLVGPRPAECVACLQAWDGIAIYGNTDDWVLGRQQAPERLGALTAWTAAQLTAEQQAWLANLAFEQRFSPTGQAAEDLLVVHANPQDVNQLIFPPEQKQVERYGRVRQPDEDLAAMMNGVEAAVLAFGHLHVPSIRPWGDMQLVNISSVSMAGDGDARAKYGLFTWQDGAWSFERRFVGYLAEEERRAYLQNMPPGWESFVAQIEQQGFVPQVI
jgi:predicted phosphodiesterase